MQTVWQNRVRAAVRNNISAHTLAAFNTNVDVVVHLRQDRLEPLLASSRIDLQEVEGLLNREIPSVSSANGFLAVLMRALREGKSVHIVLRDMAMLDWLEEVFPERAESMGGQAGIIANQMSALGAHSLVYTALLSPKQASMFFPEFFSRGPRQLVLSSSGRRSGLQISSRKTGFSSMPRMNGSRSGSTLSSLPGRTG